MLPRAGPRHEIGGDRIDALSQVLHPARREGLLYERAKARVIWRILVEHARHERADELRHPREFLPLLFCAEHAERVFGEARVFERSGHVGVARQEPRGLLVAEGDLRDRRFGAHPRVNGGGVCLVLSAAEIGDGDHVRLPF